MSCRCEICPNNCVIKDDSFGICGVRGCRDNELYLPYHGLISSSGIDPIEKKPLYHYKPAETVFSIGFYGCSLSCPFCQNYSISKEFGLNTGRFVAPADIIEHAVNSGSRAIAYTYSEPVVHFEYIIETARAAEDAGLKNILVTNGYVNKNAGNELLNCMDAVNIDLKSFTDDFYKRELKGRLSPVLDFIGQAVNTTHTEITTLVIPGKNDSTTEITEASKFLSGLNKNIPYHLSAYYPVYKYSVKPTSTEALIYLAETASEFLNFVFTGNISGGLSDSLCPVCSNTLIRRSGYFTSKPGISGDACSNCGTLLTSLGIIL